jgi:hypothetical protein
LSAEALRNGNNVFSTVVLQLNLTLKQATTLQAWLSEANASGELDSCLRAELLSCLEEAHADALRLHTCPVCQQTFAQGQRGRMAVYCSAACKQKAYRQRVNASRRYFPRVRQ